MKIFSNALKNFLTVKGKYTFKWFTFFVVLGVGMVCLCYHFGWYPGSKKKNSLLTDYKEAIIGNSVLKDVITLRKELDDAKNEISHLKSGGVSSGDYKEKEKKIQELEKKIRNLENQKGHQPQIDELKKEKSSENSQNKDSLLEPYLTYTVDGDVIREYRLTPNMIPKEKDHKGRVNYFHKKDFEDFLKLYELDSFPIEWTNGRENLYNLEYDNNGKIKEKHEWQVFKS